MVDSIAEYYRDYEHNDPGNKYTMREILRLIPESGCKILDVGCGTAEKSKYFRKRGNQVIGIDISSSQIERARKVLDTVLISNIKDGISFKNNKFDIVYSSMVLEHIFNFKNVLTEIYRVLKPDGRVIIEVPNVHYWPNRFLMFFGKELIWIGIGKHIRAFNKSNLARSLKKVGFREIKIIGSILPIPKTNLKVHFPFFNRVLPGLCYSLIAYAKK